MATFFIKVATKKHQGKKMALLFLSAKKGGSRSLKEQGRRWLARENLGGEKKERGGKGEIKSCQSWREEGKRGSHELGATSFESRLAKLRPLKREKRRGENRGEGRELSF